MCEAKNHESYLIDFYYDEDDSIKILRDQLIKNMDSEENMSSYKINFGIPCCSCFTEIFG
ncbi:MAG: hypothetical protein ACFFAH_14210 [Promethearchaeota archaeon]